MNPIAMLSQALPSLSVAPKPNANPNNGSQLFSVLLQKQGYIATSPLVQMNGSSNESNHLNELLEEIKVDLHALTDRENQDLTISTGTTMDILDLEQLRLLLNEQITGDVEVPTMGDNVLGVIVEPDQISLIHQKLTEILNHFESILSEVPSQEEMKRIAPKILELLKQWSALEKGISITGGQEQAVNNLTENHVWKDILLAYQNRIKLTDKQQYQNDAQVTTKDVVKWLENALQNQQTLERVSPVQNLSFQSNVFIPKLEQYAIFINQSQSGQTAEQQLVDQFQQVIKTSKFLSLPNGMNQLSIALRPGNLGEMMVRLTEINGEMTVKIVVSTQAAKEMLESNISQLKHLFSPQQVVIERQDITTGQGQASAKQNDEQSLQSQQQGHSEDSEPQQESNNSGDDFEARLDEMIQNMEA